MIKINDILKLVNEGFETHYFKDITSYGVCELVSNEDNEGNVNTRPAIYDDKGNYTFIEDDTKGLIIYHRIIEFSNDENLESGFGRNSMTTETYGIKTVFIGQQPSIEDDNCEDINFYLAKEFKKLMPRRLNLADTNRISVTGIDYDRTSIEEAEGIKTAPSTVVFAINSNIVIKSIETCNTLNCN